MENEIIPKADVNAQVELLKGHLAQLRQVVPLNPTYLIAEANMSCRFLKTCHPTAGAFVLIFFTKRGPGFALCPSGRH